MPQKLVLIPGVGEVLLVKRRGAKNIRLSISASGQVRVSLPPWVPYATGIRFTKSRSDWLQKHLEGRQTLFLKNGDSVGKFHKLEFVVNASDKISTRVTQTQIIVKSNLPLASATVQQKAVAASERALLLQAKKLLPQRLAEISNKQGYGYESVKIKKLTSRWGSCSSQKAISLSYYLIQLPWHLIDYVLIHELVHTNQMNHSAAFWNEVAKNIPDFKNRRKELKSYKPSLQIGSLVS